MRGNTKKWDIGPGAGGGFFLVVVGAVAFLCMIAALASKDGWWEMCHKVPCESPSVPVDLGDLTPCDVPDMVGLRMAFPDTNFDAICMTETEDCYTKRCQAAYDLIAKATNNPSPYVEEITCLSQQHIPQSGYVAFGQICCNICNQGQFADLEYVFRKWAADRQSCGLFGCSVGDYYPQDDFCYTRAQHVEASQAFAVITTLFTGLLTFYHILGLVYQDGSKRQIPLPRAVSTIAGFLRRYMHWCHYFTAFMAFVGGVLMIATLTEPLCGARLSDYVESRFAVRILWFAMTVHVISGSYYLLTVKGYLGLSKIALANTAVGVAVPGNEEVTTPGPIVRPNSPQVEQTIGGEEPALELHAIRMSPEEGAMEVDDEPAPAPLEGGRRGETREGVAPPSLS